jgi:2-C-methyl-D-erythritol 2,4-cyclodiphosphate synthase
VNPATIRIGIGHDTHRLKPGGPLRLGGIDIEHTHSLDGHSDADVLLHAVTDSILGAAALGDIGELFPDTAAENKDRDSAEMLAQAAEQIAAAGYRISNLDCIVFAQTPKLSPHKRTMAQRIAEILDIESGQIGVKAKTGEGTGPVGQQIVMMAQCVALIYRPDP